jgi:hypothetical protein
MPWKICLSVAAMVFLCAASGSLPRHLVDAETLVAEISPANNVYMHKDCFIKWKGEDGATRYENRSDCSDFLALLIEHSYGVTTDQLRQWTGERRPYAGHWHDAIVAGSGFEQIRKLSDARPGDVLAVKFPPHMADSGHIMLLAATPTQMTARDPIEPGTQQWSVTIIDSTKSPHGPDDTRAANGSTGVGRGTVRIYSDSSGAVAGYTWSTGSKAKFESQDQRNLVIGRLDVAK